VTELFVDVKGIVGVSNQLSIEALPLQSAATVTGTTDCGSESAAHTSDDMLIWSVQEDRRDGDAVSESAIITNGAAAQFCEVDDTVTANANARRRGKASTR
jgi:hypothetical protein